MSCIGPNGSSLERRRLYFSGSSTISGRESFREVGEGRRVVATRSGVGEGHDRLRGVTGPIPRIPAWRAACYRLASWGTRRRAELARVVSVSLRSDQVLQRSGRGLLLSPLQQLG